MQIQKSKSITSRIFNILSPAVIAGVVVLCIMVSSLVDAKGSDGWSMLAFWVMAPALGIIIMIHLSLRFGLKKSGYRLWVWEVILLALCYFLYDFILERWIF